jgi:tRNA A37 threonylcarbamoyladenosine synthetase subunit TsaC/SUA5/YrdC
MAIKTVTYHQRSTGKTGQVLASQEIEAKLSKVEALYREYHGVKLGRGKFYDLALQYAREAKSDTGGYLQYTTEAIAGIFLDHMHKELGKAVKLKNRNRDLSIEIGSVSVSNLRDLARNGRGKAKKVA